VLSRHEAEPSGKIAAFAERLSGWSEGNQSRSDQRPNSRDRHQPARHLIFLGTSPDLSIKFEDLIIKPDLRFDQDQQCCARFSGNSGGG